MPAAKSYDIVTINETWSTENGITFEPSLSQNSPYQTNEANSREGGGSA